MAMPFLNITESPLNFDKFKNKPKNSNLKSFWAFLISIFIYISVFYVFNLSPSTLLCSTKFWFIISNTLILIIAADFGAFSSSNGYDFYDEYMKNKARTKSTNPSFQIPYLKTHQKAILPNYYVEEKTHEKIIEMDEAAEDDCTDMQKIVITHQNPSDKIDKTKQKMGIMDLEAENEGFEVRKKATKCVRSNSDKAILMAAENDEKKHVLQRTMSERSYEEQKLEENDEFSSMSDEELNRRVEDFIRKFNRQIRLQADRNRRQNMD